MKINKEIRPYKGTITKNGCATMFSCQDSKKDASGNWVKSPFYKVYAGNIAQHIDEKNPQNLKIIVKSIESVTVEDYETKDGRKGVSTTIWSNDVEIVKGEKKEVKAENPEGFTMIQDEEIPF